MGFWAVQIGRGLVVKEHRARLAILKAAVDYALAHRDGPPEFMSEDGQSFFFQGLTYHALPMTFHEGMEWLREQPNFRRYATFWQQFLWGWGGFYLEDRESEEFEWMAAYSGIPADEIPTALEAFDRFFPIPNGWFTTPGWTDIHLLKMVPMTFQGIGAHQRRIQYTLADNVSALKPSAPYTIGRPREAHQLHGRSPASCILTQSGAAGAANCRCPRR
ncbi:hypothetical protein [Streptomyces barringtoniae]|uniref:hypothetical protein n=1 Tax=Streptomyces barringtoniae TaxID=2892029 RepID=UPI001E577AB4|nr:hypothetical protein [Streptomyces barringtoniae]MCC5481200.1 hypothetical protein [Streptomyces barringtoniae]